MKYEYKLTELDFIEAIRLTMKIDLWKILLLYVFISTTCFIIINYLTQEQTLNVVFAILFPILFFPSFKYLFPILHAKKTFKNYSLINQTQSIEFTEDGFNLFSNNGETTLVWSNILKWRENENIILVYISPQLYHIIPKTISANGFELTVFQKKLKNVIGNAI